MTLSHGLIFDHRKIEDCSIRIAYQIYENNLDQEEIVLVGIEDNGIIYAKKISVLLQKISSLKIKFVHLLINKENPLERVSCSCELSELTNKSVVVIDDVLNTGSTLMYAVKFLLDMPLHQIQTAVLVNRNHKKYPIKADFKGISLSTSINERIEVSFEKGKEGVYLM